LPFLHGEVGVIKTPKRISKVNGALNEQLMTKQYIVYLNMFNHFATRTILRRSTPVFGVGLLSALGKCNRDKADIRQAETKRH
jgi:hypothetical protein